MIRFFFIIIIALIAASCQVGCPGGMCPPDKYYATYKKAGKHGMTSTKNSPEYRSFNRSRNLRTDWSRKSSTGRSSLRKNFESDKFTGHGNAGSRYYTGIEENPFNSKGLRGKSKGNNFESDKFAGHGNAGSRFYTDIEDNPFYSKGSKGKSKGKDFESDKFAGQSNGGSKNYTAIEEKVFRSKKSKSHNYSRLLGAKKIKHKSRSGHEEGLFAGNVNRYQEKKTYHVKKRGRLADKVGVKKLR